MYNAQQMQALRAEVTQAVKAQDPVAALEVPAHSVEGDDALIHLAADCGVLAEAALNRYIGTYYQRKDRAGLSAATADRRLGHPSIRAYWQFASGLRDCEPDVSLERMIAAYRTCPPNSSSRLRFIQLLFAQSYREEEFGFLSHWIAGATDEELATIPNKFVYGALIGLIHAGQVELARNILARRAPRMDALDELYFTVPKWMLSEQQGAAPATDTLVARLHAALPERGPEWDWFCNAYRRKIAEAGVDFTNIRMEPGKADALRTMILGAVGNCTPLSFQRMGDGSAYRLALPDCAASCRDQISADDHLREEAWWQRRLSTERGDFFAAQVMEALKGADILGVCSAHRLIRDAVPNASMTQSTTGRALLAHVHALANVVPLAGKCITEDRAHTLLYTRDFLAELIAAADHVVVVGGLSPGDMELPSSEAMTFLPLLPEQNKGLPVAAGAVSIIDDFEQLHERVEAACRPGCLLLVSGGYVGKSLVHAGKLAGAVALDIGSRADTLAGHATRSPADAV